MKPNDFLQPIILLFVKTIPVCKLISDSQTGLTARQGLKPDDLGIFLATEFAESVATVKDE